MPPANHDDAWDMRGSFHKLASSVATLAALGLLAGLASTEHALAQGAGAAGQVAGERKLGRDSKLQVPRYVSLKSNEVNVRRGPALSHGIMWVYRRSGLPVEVLAEYGAWRKVRDSEGSVGWVFGRLLSGRRTALVTPWAVARKKTSAAGKALVADVATSQQIPVRVKGRKSARIVALVEARVIANITACSGQWCKVSLYIGRTEQTIRGWIEQKLLWGVYPQERVN